MTTFLLDMDGTLFDTEKYYNRAWKQAISDSGYELPEEEVLKLRSLGASLRVGTVSTLVWTGGGLPGNPGTSQRIDERLFVRTDSTETGSSGDVAVFKSTGIPSCGCDSDRTGTGRA